MDFPDESFLYRVSQGDEAAFSQLCAHYRLPALKFCKVLLKDEDKAETLLRNVFAGIWEHRFLIRREQSFQAYLFINLRNQIFDQLKKVDKDQYLRQQYLGK